MNQRSFLMDGFYQGLSQSGLSIGFLISRFIILKIDMNTSSELGGPGQIQMGHKEVEIPVILIKFVKNERKTTNFPMGKFGTSPN